LYGDQKRYFLSPSFELQCEYVVAVLQGDIKKLAVSVPPRNSKSQIWSCAMPMWEWLTNPETRFISVCHSNPVLDLFQTDRIRIFNSEDYQRIIDYKLLTKTKEKFENSAGGHILSMVTAYIHTGLGANIIIVDDPVAAKDRNNMEALLKAREKFTGELMSRMDDKINGRWLVVSQRLAEGDIIDLALELGYDYLKLQSIQQGDITYEFPLTKTKWLRKDQDVLNPGHESREILEELRKANLDSFLAQYQQEPRVEGNGVVDRDAIRMYTELKKGYKSIIVSVDSASSVKTGSSGWGITVWGMWNEGLTNLDLLYATSKKYEFPEGLARVLQIYKEYNGTEFFIENKSTGTALIPTLKNAGYKVYVAVPTKSKEERFMACAPMINQGRVRVPDTDVLPFTLGWMSNWDYEIRGFPNAKTRDLVDSTSQILQKYSEMIVSLESFYKLNVTRN
jgi:predicted phage terminase large subunit-like protein